MNPLNKFLCYLNIFALLEYELIRLGAGEFDFVEWDSSDIYVPYHEWTPIWEIPPDYIAPDAIKMHHAEFREYAFVSPELGKGWSVFIAVAPEINKVYWYLGGYYFWTNYYWRYKAREL